MQLTRAGLRVAGTRALWPAAVSRAARTCGQMVLQSCLIFTSSGLVIFSKQFTSRGVERLFGALIRTILELSVATTGEGLRRART